MSHNNNFSIIIMKFCLYDVVSSFLSTVGGGRGTVEGAESLVLGEPQPQSWSRQVQHYGAGVLRSCQILYTERISTTCL